MTRLQRYRRSPRPGFTMVELLVVIGLILFLMSISIVALNSALGLARQRATQATILKVHGLMQQRVEAFNRALDQLNLQPAITKLQRDLGVSNSTNPLVYQVLVRKQIYQQRFPQSFYETNISGVGTGTNSTAHQQVTESAALLYWILTKSEIYGISPVDQSEFSSSEAKDTDGDGLLELVDGWGKPLRYYRWPTHLFRPGNSSVAPGIAGSTTPIVFSPIDRTWASILWTGLPAPTPATAAGALDPLARDPDDPTGALRRFAINSPAAMTLLQNRFHTPDTYNTFLIVSAGPDNTLGLGEPYDYGPNPNAPGPDTSLAPSQPATWPLTVAPALGNTSGQGRLAVVLSYNTQVNAIFDNLTNRRR